METIVGVFAHPDDEAFGPGGTLAKLVQEGHEVYIVCCTDGNHQDRGLKHVRNVELHASAKILGVKEVIFLDFVDGYLCNANYHDLVDKLKVVLDKLKPKTIITFHPNGVSGHLDHIAVTSVVDYLFPKLKYLKKIMYFCMRDIERKFIPGYFVHMPSGVAKNQTDLVIDIAHSWDTKVKAMKQHKSQSKDLNLILLRDTFLPKEEYFLVKEK